MISLFSSCLRSILVTCFATGFLTGQVEKRTIDGQDYWVQGIAGDRARLSANECYFDGRGLRCTGKGPADLPGAELNRGQSFARIEGLKGKLEISWFLHIPRPGEITASLSGVPAGPEVSRFRLKHGDQAVNFEDGKARLSFLRSGVYRLRLGAPGKKALSLDGLELAGAALEGGAILRSRWRPLAVHGKFSASKLTGTPHLWIMEVDGLPAPASCYAPITTPFGYYGSSWTPEGKPTGLNFSLWSYGRGKKEPPLRELSHLLSLGNPSASFGGYGHEGTGVKPRDWNPFASWQGGSAVYALRLEAGKPYDTYYSYFFDEKKKVWQLYASGRKFSAKKKRRKGAERSTVLTLGSFVEVPGPPARQRTGHIVRKVRYRGFLLNRKGETFAIDRLSAGNKQGEPGHRGRGIDAEGRFFMWMGGMPTHPGSRVQKLEKGPDPAKFEWMKPEKLKALYSQPSEVSISELSLVGNILRVTGRVRGLGKDARATLFLGGTNALTLAKRWENSLPLSKVKEGKQVWEIALPWDQAAPPKIHVRLLLENDRGKFWSLETATTSRDQ